MSSKRSSPRITLLYVTLAFVLGLGAGAGLAFTRVLSGVSFTDDRREHAFFYLYTLVATTAVFVLLGFLVAGRHHALERSRDRFETLSNQDPLTFLANARAFKGHYSRVAGAPDSGEPLSLLMVDVDDLKRVNDEHGHAAGNAVLRHVAAALQSCKRTGDVAARWGGDEFAVLLRGASLDSARRVAESVQEELRRTPLTVRGRPLAPTVTIGLATRESASDGDLFTRADAALLEGKRAGRNRVCVAGGSSTAGSEVTSGPGARVGD